MNSPFPPFEQIAAVYLVECLFGIGFNRMVAWAHEHKLWDVSISVVIGVLATLLVPTAAWPTLELRTWQIALLLLGCFAASGAPMMIGSTRRTVAERESHHRRPWPTAAAQARDDAVMALTTLAEEIAEMTRADKINVRHLPDIVNRLHRIIGTLKSV